MEFRSIVLRPWNGGHVFANGQTSLVKLAPRGTCLDVLMRRIIGLLLWGFIGMMEDKVETTM